MYTCDPTKQVCVKSKNGHLPHAVCEQQCMKIPIVPIQVAGKFFRGLQINKGYVQGEWQANFTKINVTVTNPSGKSMVGAVSIVGEYMVVDFPSGTVSSLWQYEGGIEVDFFSWAWSAPGGTPPQSFDDAMTTSGMTEYEFVTCVQGKPGCQFHA